MNTDKNFLPFYKEVKNLYEKMQNKLENYNENSKIYFSRRNNSHSPNTNYNNYNNNTVINKIPSSLNNSMSKNNKENYNALKTKYIHLLKENKLLRLNLGNSNATIKKIPIENNKLAKSIDKNINKNTYPNSTADRNIDKKTITLAKMIDNFLKQMKDLQKNK